MERAEVFYSGIVQGVGFRYTAVNIAQRFNVTGYVKNLPDGRVELVAEGERAEVEAFLAAVQDEMAGYIRNVSSSWGKASGEFKRFSVRF